MNPLYKYWAKCQRCPKYVCESRQSENALISSMPFTGEYTWHIQAPCNYTSHYDCHNKDISLHFYLREFNGTMPLEFLSVRETFEYLLTNSKNLEEAISITKIIYEIGLQ